MRTLFSPGEQMLNQSKLRPYVDVNTSPPFIEMMDQHRTTSPLLDTSTADDQSAQPNEQHDDYHDDDSDRVRWTDENETKNGDHVSPSQAVLWNRLPYYSLLWEMSGVVLSICFLSKPVHAHPSSSKLISHSIGCMRCITRGKVGERMVSPYHPGHKNCSFALANCLLGHPGKCSTSTSKLES
jgi:hypothetical protein